MTTRWRRTKLVSERACPEGSGRARGLASLGWLGLSDEEEAAAVQRVMPRVA
jgi:hypothetical protein